MERKVQKYLSKIKRLYCTDVQHIENYDSVVNSKGGWVLHHRLETHFEDGTPRPLRCNLTSHELTALGMYYNRPANELIFLPKSEHCKLHACVNNNFKPLYGNKNMLGKHMSEDTKEKIRNSCKSVPHNGEWNKKVGVSLKAYWETVSADERKARLEKANKASVEKPLTQKQIEARRNNCSRIKNKGHAKGKKKYTNGVETHFYFEGQQPEGFYLGQHYPAHNKGVKKEGHCAREHSSPDERAF